MADTALAEHEVIAGLDIGGTKMLGVLIHGRGTVKARLRRPTTMRGDDAVRDGILDMLQALIDLGRQQRLSTSDRRRLAGIREHRARGNHRCDQPRRNYPASHPNPEPDVRPQRTDYARC